MMKVHTFRADSLQEALQQVRQALGPDAAVLQTRERRRGLLGVFSTRQIEVEATSDLPVASRFATQRDSSQRDSSQPKHQESKAKPSRSRLKSTDLREPADAPEPNAAKSIDDSPPAAMRSSESLSATEFEVLTDLLEAGIAAEAARGLLADTKRAASEVQLQDAWLLRAKLSQIVASKLSVSGSIEVKAGTRQVVALVGPTGVGKTTTLAKVAAGFRFDLGCKIGLITLDTFRLGAVDQLLQYAELIAAPLEVVSSPDQVGGALQRLSDCDLVLLDTAGRSPRDAEQLSLLADFLRSAAPDSVQLVVSAASAPSNVKQTMERFSVLKPTNLMITKLDEAVEFGSWMSLLCENRLPISYLTTGQHVPQDIAVASGRRLSSLLLGGSLAENATSLGANVSQGIATASHAAHNNSASTHAGSFQTGAAQ